MPFQKGGRLGGRADAGGIVVIAQRRPHGDDLRVAVEGERLERVVFEIKRVIVGPMTNWSRNVLLWNLAADPQFNPHTNNGGCGSCQGAVTIDHDTVTRNLAFYTLAQASKFVRPGSVRIQSVASLPDALANVAFKATGGKTVLIVANTSATPQSFNIRFHGKLAATSLPAGAVGTYVW